MIFSELKGNYKQIQSIKEFLNDHINQTLLIVGDDSTGKTSILNILQNNGNNEILVLNDHNFSENTIENFVHCKTITSFFSKGKTKLIFFDDIDTFSSIQKQHITLLHRLKVKCKMIFTIKLKEERRINTLWKKFFDKRICLNKLSYKECLQVVLTKLHTMHDDDDIDYDLLLELIKVNECNITNIMMLKDSVIINDMTTPCVYDNIKDLFETNIYDIVHSVFNENLSQQYIEAISSKDSSMLSTMIHENLTQTKLTLTNYISIYDTMCHCDIMDKFIFVNCMWGINWICTNIYRYSKVNKHLMSEPCIMDKKAKIVFSQQFTKLSAQVNMKKKIRSLGLNYFQSDFINILYYLHKSDKKCDDKILNDLIKKFAKDFEL